MRERDFFIDRLRSVIIALVVLHHTAITYGAWGGWFYYELRPSSTPSSVILTQFCATNQAYIMGILFLLAGYFTPGSLERKGYARFLSDRFLRLGLPLLAFGLILGPLTVAMVTRDSGRPSSGSGTTGNSSTGRYGLWATCAITELGFIRLSSNPGFTRDAVTPYEAAALLERLVAVERHEYWGELPHLSRAECRRMTGHRQVTDFYLTKLATLHKAKVATFDSRIQAITAPERLELINR
jgi:predicted nucleic acid-binding protein